MKPWLRKYNIYLFLTGLFILSRALYHMIGVGFEMELLDRGWQYLDVELLKNDLFRSVFYLHSQPPLMNLFLGLVLKLPENWHIPVFHFCYLLSGLSIVLLMADSLLKLGVSKIITGILTVLFIFNPAVVIYESWIFYTYFEVLFLVLLVWSAVNYFTSEENRKYAVIFFITLAILCLTRSLFHIGFFVMVVAFFIITSKKKKQVFYASILPFLSVFFWYLKNLFLIGSFTASSWFGMNFAKMSYNWNTPLGQTGIWGKPELYDSLYHFKATPNGHPAMESWHKENGNINFNFKGYIQISNDFKKDAIAELKKHPENYWKNVKVGTSIFFEPTEQVRYGFFETNNRNTKSIRKWYNFGYDYPDEQIGTDLIWIRALSYILIIIGSVFLLYFYRKTYITKIILLLLFFLFYIFFVSNLLELYENNRFRFPTIPLVIILVALQLQFIVQCIRKKLRR